ncbi:MAG: type II toxin-antitoxin system Phd/YefM family antitoxin [Kiritimatiellia bacterium]|jgi:antitoxin (DNA-binding transcriptional repressor) of toxin-antitoxin stability system
MTVVSLFDAKTHLSRIVGDLVAGKEREVLISRHGKPVAKLQALRSTDTSKRIGLAKGKFRVPDNIDRSNDKIVDQFHGAGNKP